MALNQPVILFVVVACLTAPLADAAGRGLSQINNAQVIRPSSSSSTASRSSLTTKDAEATANAAFGGVHRLVAPSDRRTYATVDGHSSDINTNNRAIQPRARAAQDLPGGPNRGNGASSMPALVMGGMAHAQTYEGATSTATTDSLALNRGGATISNARLTTRTGALKGAVPGTSYGVTSSQGVGSKALSGNANGHIVLAQADNAVAMAQAERN